MNFLALLLGLGLERLLTRLFHLREFRWLDPVFDRALARVESRGRVARLLRLGLLALLLAAPVALASALVLLEMRPVPAFLFAVLVLLFSLGPRDLEQEVADYVTAAQSGTAATAGRTGREIVEADLPADAAVRDHAVEAAIYVQATNRVFGVVFWFLVLGSAGPAGAWLFRVVDLMRHRATSTRPGSAALASVRVLHGLLAWIPARLMAAGFALAGSFRGAVMRWREGGPPATFFARTDALAERVGRGARATAPGVGAGACRAAIALVRRTLWLVWYPVIALLTLGNWLR